MNPPVLPNGRGVWLWPPSEKIADIEPDKVIPKLHGLGFHYVIPQLGLATPSWLTPARVRAFNDAGFKVIAGIGSPGPRYVDPIAKALSIGVDACHRAAYPLAGVMLDWEGAWDQARPAAVQVVAKLRAQYGTTVLPILDCPWWAPDKDPGGHATHPSAPTAEFGVLCACERAPQCYGAPIEGQSSRMLAWARHEYGAVFPGHVIVPSVQLYKRSVKDHLSILLSEPKSLHWDLAEMDQHARVAHMLAVALEDRPEYIAARRVGLPAADGIKAVQHVLGLVDDGIVGPKTTAALGVPFAPDTLWKGDWSRT